MYFVRFKLLPTVLGLLITAFACWFFVYEQSGYVNRLITRVDQAVYDFRTKALGAIGKKTHRDVVVIKIDEKSLKQQGRWPWSRHKITQLVHRLQKDDAAVIAFDIIFSEKQHSIIEQLQQHLKHLPPSVSALKDKLNYDKGLEKALAKSDTALGFVFTEDPISVGQLPKSMFSAAEVAKMQLNVLQLPGFIAPLAQFTRSATTGGFISYFRDADGMTRRVPLLIEHDKAVWGSLALQTARLFLLLDSVEPQIAHVNKEYHPVYGVQLARYIIPTDAVGQVLVPFQYMPTISSVSAADVINGTVKASALEGKIALIGFTAKGLTDLVATPINRALPGVYVHGCIIQGILNHHFPYEPDWQPGAMLIALIVFGIILSVLLPWLPPLWQVVTGVVPLVGILIANGWLWSTHSWVLNVGLLVVLIVVISVFNFIYGFLFEQRLRKKFKNLFGKYIPPEHVDQLSKQSRSQQKLMEGESKYMSVLFADIRGFTAISEQLTAKQVKQLLNDFLTPMTKAILENSGTIDKYIGDAIMAFWGAPLDDDDHKLHAVKTGFAMLQAAHELEAHFTALNFPEVRIGIGINSGTMNVGDMGSEYRRSYTVLGDEVNLASRLESLTKSYGLSFIVGQETAELDGPYTFRLLDRVRVKGKDESVDIYEPMGLTDALTDTVRQEIQQFDAALQCYFKGDWQQAQQLFNKLQMAAPDAKLYPVFLERIGQMIKTPPDDWQGVYAWQEK